MLIRLEVADKYRCAAFSKPFPTVPETAGRKAAQVRLKGTIKSGFMEETNMEDNKSITVKKTVKSGITFGSALAMVISYTTWKSVGWAIFHGLLSWVYVIYFLLRY